MAPWFALGPSLWAERPAPRLEGSMVPSSLHGWVSMDYISFCRLVESTRRHLQALLLLRTRFASDLWFTVAV